MKSNPRNKAQRSRLHPDRGLGGDQRDGLDEPDGLARLDGMLRTQSSLQTRADEVRTLQAGLAQWQTDLDQLAELPGTPSWDWDGRVLRLTRRSAAPPANTTANTATNTLSITGTNSPGASVRVVAWTWRTDPGRPGGGDWLRWQSGPLSQRQDWQTAWNTAQQWSQTPSDSTRAAQVQIHPLSGWQLFVHRGGSWTNPLSSDVVTPNPAQAGNPAGRNNPGQATPDGVRLVLSLPPGAAGAGTLSMDWVRPTLSGAPS
jgi:general secretion pathway protein J